MPTNVIAERIGWEKGMTVLKDRVREQRPAYLPVDPAARRHRRRSGELSVAGEEHDEYGDIHPVVRSSIS
ncbi:MULTISPECIES: hypothetical protein [unclassified Streptomyces]|uniref:hypothetical protein n=1 Tax=unclassified Streptomyces TaxID=2593676 RepID=UPI0022545065|nr:MULTISPECIES: hypothetical protein [unclassified Streptomyces]WSP53271.1 hypothetical protein OG306_01685 [Streptomyces sp. NBC_01241]WSU26049.1 hypothetical protein OG508_37605 [Streptomyces sp. NBC_01108]MCX4792048.1 hypothetical protein [Streptomyces sp. NBC_01221]MCX4799710.1 hypothetical protein [Streptomyces sp. NBC_01242]WSJ40574.1 hypothetical protein OG772_34575 [Streptomyces sp. NBC_01321]